MATLILFAFSLIHGAHAEANTQVERIPYLNVITDFPKTSLNTLDISFSKKSVPAWAWILATTAITYEYDEVMLLDIQRAGRKNGVGNEENTKTIIEIGPYPIFRAPSDLGSALYYLGDGWTHFAIVGGFWANGYWGNSNRAHNTALQLVHGMAVSTMFNQALKRSTGRESPSLRTEKRGKWRPFPSFNAYNSRTPFYDAYPSGHVMTSMLTFTIINSNYPEYSKYIVPLGSVWITALALQMMNNGVHWASDYPLAIGMGYVVAKATINSLGKPKSETQTRRKGFFERWMVMPAYFDDAPGFQATLAL